MRASPGFTSRGEAEMHHVAVGDDVVLAFQPEPAGIARARLAAIRHIIVIRDGLGANEAALEVAVDDTGSLRSLGAAPYGPGRRLLGAGSEIGDEVEKLIAGQDQPVEAGHREPNGLEILV